MSATQWIITAIEFVVIGAVIVGLFYEPIVAEWEEKQKEKVLRAFKKRREFRK